MAEEKKAAKEKRPTALKRDIQHEKRRLANRSFKSRIKTAVRSYEKVAAEKNEQEATTQLNSLYSLLDKAVKTGVYKINKAARLKSKYAAKI
ncbi:MAG: 30S ribosomal protein S20 [Verrucomicrobia bacterium]|nr:30S ribosomal protein S20 [Verrucomicrobiota bacterium]